MVEEGHKVLHNSLSLLCWRGRPLQERFDACTTSERPLSQPWILHRSTGTSCSCLCPTSLECPLQPAWSDTGQSLQTSYRMFGKVFGTHGGIHSWCPGSYRWQISWIWWNHSMSCVDHNWPPATIIAAKNIKSFLIIWWHFDNSTSMVPPMPLHMPCAVPCIGRLLSKKFFI